MHLFHVLEENFRGEKEMLTAAWASISHFMDSNLIHMIKGQELNDDPAVPNLLMTIVLTT